MACSTTHSRSATSFRDGLAGHPLVSATTGRGLLVGVVLAEPVTAEVQKAALAAGIILNNATPTGCVWRRR